MVWVSTLAADPRPAKTVSGFERNRWAIVSLHVPFQSSSCTVRRIQALAEADAGTLAMPEVPATVYIMHGEGYDADAGEIIAPFLRWAVYTPWATLESTGLPPQPTGPGAPWLMFPDTPGAHIMITPAPPGGGN